MRAVLRVGLFALALALSARPSSAEVPELTFEHGDRTRTYRLHVPPAASGSPGSTTKKLALVFVLHGGGGTAKSTPGLLKGRMEELADKEGFLVCYPDGIEKGWNDGRVLPPRAMAKREGVDDVGFISSLIDVIARDHPVDPACVYSTGISNGGFMSYRLGVDLADRIAAIAPVDANLSDEIRARVATGRPVPLLAINGTEDPLVPWAGGDVHVGPLKRGKCLSVADSIRLWCQRNHAVPEAEVKRLPDRDAGDSTHVREERHAPLAGGADVVLLAVEGGGHTWPGGMQYLPELVIGKTSRQIDACEMIWRFFAEHPMPPRTK